MKYLLHYCLFFAGTFLSVAAIAQEEKAAYTVQIGNFIKPQQADFANLNALGFVYAGREQTNYTNVFIGGYDSEKEAAKVVETLKAKGYANAFVSRLNPEGGTPVSVIQLATNRSNTNIDWNSFARAGSLYVLLQEDQVKILTGIFPDPATAKQQLSRLQQAGFKDAFVKVVNNALLHEVTDFEAGNSFKKPLIPLDLPEKTPAIVAKPGIETPASYEVTQPALPQKEKEELTAKGPAALNPSSTKPRAVSFSAAKPTIRSNFKRTSALELQKILKTTGVYDGSLDGYFGKDSKTALEKIYASNYQIQKYRLLSAHASELSGKKSLSPLQTAINNLWDTPEASLLTLNASGEPIAKAYKACFLFAGKGPGAEVNSLMNQALREAFSSNKLQIPNFNPAATYAYQDMEQLLLHLKYLHQSSAARPAVACWLFRQFPGPALKAFSPEENNANLSLQPCGGFWDWEEVQMLWIIALDLCPASECAGMASATSLEELYRLYLAPKAPDDKTSKALEAWNASLWRGIQGWASRDPMLSEAALALRINFLHTELLLEDFFLGEGFQEKEAKTLALQALKALSGNQLQRFL